METRLLDKINRFTESFVSGMNKGLMVIVILLLLAMTVSVSLQVFFRYVVKNSLPWSEEFARYTMIWLVMISAGLAFSYDSHVGVDILIDRVPNDKTRMVLKFLSYLIIAVFSLILVKWGWQIASRVRMQRSPAMRVSMLWFYLSIPTGGVIFTIQSIRLMIETIAKGGER